MSETNNMAVLKIVAQNGVNYTLQNEKSKQKYQFILTFFDVEESIKVNDLLIIHKDLINEKYEGYSKSYSFGALESKYGKKVDGIQDIDCIAIKTENKTIYLKRLYG